MAGVGGESAAEKARIHLFFGGRSLAFFPAGTELDARAEDGGMALREFHDRKGVRWRVWSGTRQWLDKRPTAEECRRDWQDGWPCFGCQDSRRRPARFPPGWEDLSDAELEGLLSRAQTVKRCGTEERAGE